MPGKLLIKQQALALYRQEGDTNPPKPLRDDAGLDCCCPVDCFYVAEACSNCCPMGDEPPDNAPNAVYIPCLIVETLPDWPATFYFRWRGRCYELDGEQTPVAQGSDPVITQEEFDTFDYFETCRECCTDALFSCGGFVTPACFPCGSCCFGEGDFLNFSITMDGYTWNVGDTCGTGVDCVFTIPSCGTKQSTYSFCTCGVDELFGGLVAVFTKDGEFDPDLPISIFVNCCTGVWEFQGIGTSLCNEAFSTCEPPTQSGECCPNLCDIYADEECPNQTTTIDPDCTRFFYNCCFHLGIVGADGDCECGPVVCRRRLEGDYESAGNCDTMDDASEFDCTDQELCKP